MSTSPSLNMFYLNLTVWAGEKISKEPTATRSILVYSPKPAETAITNNLRELTEDVLSTLTPREKEIIKMRFGLDQSGEERTLEEVGKHFSVPRERIRQIEAKALAKLRHPSRSRRLRAFLDGTAMAS